MPTENPLDNAPLCPTCHSKISPTGKRKQGQNGLDSSEKNVPTWSGDPVITPDGLNGQSYIGTQYITADIIKELQDARKNTEELLGIEPLTEFSTVDKDTRFIGATHITELRISTERILHSTNTTLADYFSLDSAGNPQPPGPGDVENKTEWTDISRGQAFNSNNINKNILTNNNSKFLLIGTNQDETNKKQTPTVPSGTTIIKGLHIEDLRHPIKVYPFEAFTRANLVTHNVFGVSNTPDLVFTATRSTRIKGDVWDTYGIQELNQVFNFIENVGDLIFRENDVPLITSNTATSRSIRGTSKVQVIPSALKNNKGRKILVTQTSRIYSSKNYNILNAPFPTSVEPPTLAQLQNSRYIAPAGSSVSLSDPQDSRVIALDTIAQTKARVYFNYSIGGGRLPRSTNSPVTGEGLTFFHSLGVSVTKDGSTVGTAQFLLAAESLSAPEGSALDVGHVNGLRFPVGQFFEHATGSSGPPEFLFDTDVNEWYIEIPIGAAGGQSHFAVHVSGFTGGNYQDVYPSHNTGTLYAQINDPTNSATLQWTYAGFRLVN